MNRSIVTTLADELAGVIEQLTELQVSLHDIVREKLEAMRRVDTEGMLAATHREGRAASQAAVLDGRRREVVSKLCRAAGVPATNGAGGVTLRELGARLDDASRDRLAKLAERLRARMLKLAEANRVVELVSSEMLTHFKTLFAAMVLEDKTAPTYSPRGDVGPAAGARVLDAVG